MTEPNFAEELTRLVEAPRYRPGPSCGTGRAIAALSTDHPESVTQLLALMDNDTVSASLFARFLSKQGFPVAVQSVQRHRRRGAVNGCRCAR